jgi:hypothetical protein
MTDKPAEAGGQEAEQAEPEMRARADIIYLPDERQRTKKGTSGSENRQRSKAIRVRVLPADLERLKTEAAAAGVSVAAYLAGGRLGKETANRPRRQRRRQSADVAALLDALVAFNRAGNNQNQTVRALNELLLIAQEQSNARLEGLVLELTEAIRGMPVLFAAPIAAIHAALSDDREG